MNVGNGKRLNKRRFGMLVAAAGVRQRSNFEGGLVRAVGTAD
jgi:hypothetical protein